MSIAPLPTALADFRQAGGSGSGDDMGQARRSLGEEALYRVGTILRPGRCRDGGFQHKSLARHILEGNAWVVSFFQ